MAKNSSLVNAHAAWLFAVPPQSARQNLEFLTIGSANCVLPLHANLIIWEKIINSAYRIQDMYTIR